MTLVAQREAHAKITFGKKMDASRDRIVATAVHSEKALSDLENGKLILKI